MSLKLLYVPFWPEHLHINTYIYIRVITCYGYVIIHYLKTISPQWNIVVNKLSLSLWWSLENRCYRWNTHEVIMLPISLNGKVILYRQAPVRRNTLHSSRNQIAPERGLKLQKNRKVIVFSHEWLKLCSCVVMATMFGCLQLHHRTQEMMSPLCQIICFTNQK